METTMYFVLRRSIPDIHASNSFKSSGIVSKWLFGVSEVQGIQRGHIRGVIDGFQQVDKVLWLIVQLDDMAALDQFLLALGGRRLGDCK
jgi:hypothetical protein